VPWTIADNLGGFANTGGGWMGTVVKLLVSTIAVAVFAIKGVDHVDQGERALKRRFGKVLFDRRGRPKEIGPGLKVLVPFVHSLLKISVRQRVEQLSTQTRKLDDGVGYQDVVAKVIFSVVEIHPGLLVGEDLNGQIVTLCEKHFRHLVAEGVPNAMIPTVLTARADAEARRLGVVLDELAIVNEADTFATQLARSFAAAGNQPGLLPAVLPAVLPAAQPALNGHHRNGNGHRLAVEHLDGDDGNQTGPGRAEAAAHRTRGLSVARLRVWRPAAPAESEQG
jgi:hypothetical protein